MAFYLIQLLTGLASAASLFLVAAGLTIIFGVTRIVNFAHGSFYMLGAYIGFSLSRWLMASPLGEIAGFWLALPLTVLAVGLIGATFEMLVLRRLYRGDELLPLLASFALVLVLQDLTRGIWGPTELLGPQAPLLTGSLRLPGGRMPVYDLFLIVLAPLVLGGLWLLFHRTRFGVLVRAATDDGEMLAALGVDQVPLFTLVFCIGAGLAGLGGALQLPRGTANLEMDLSLIAEAFVVVVIGGMGSIGGAFLAAMLVGLVQAFGLLFLPGATLVLVFVLMALVLAVRPNGLLGRTPAGIGQPRHRRAPRLPDPLPARWQLALGLLLAVGVPWLGQDYLTSVLAEFWVLALLGASLYLLLGTGGLVSFGHAGLFGIGAYALALVSVHSGGAGNAWWLGLSLAPVAGALTGAVTGALAARRSGVYLAMLTLAAAQVLWSLAVQWVPVTGGDNGLLGLWLPVTGHRAALIYYLCAGLGLSGLVLTRLIDRSALGLSAQAIADAPARAVSAGIAIWPRQVALFALAGSLAGLAGGLHALLKGSTFPNDLGIPLSVDALAMVLLGGVGNVLGPVLGAALLHGIKVGFSAWPFWRLILGGLIIMVCVMAPAGLAGLLSTRRLARAGR